MDEKTEELRDIFQSISDSDTVTERQERGRGSLANEASIRADLQTAIEGMQADLGFDTTLSTADLVTVVERYYDGDSDREIAVELGDESLERTVARARLDLHIVREADRDTAVDLDELGDRLDDGESVRDIAADLDASPDDVRFAARVIETERERRRVADRYREAFEDVLQDRDLSERLTSSLKETGLEGATEDQEVDVDL
jgi:hypothetical protein